MPESITGSILAYMNTISDMQSRLETILTESRLNELFKPGRIKIRQEKLPYSVNIRLKLHNPYTFTAFELSQKKNGVKFSVYHLKTMPKELRLEMLALGGSQDNGNTRIDFPIETADTSAKELFKLCLSPGIAACCGAESYKPYRLLTANTEK